MHVPRYFKAIFAALLIIIFAELIGYYYLSRPRSTTAFKADKLSDYRLSASWGVATGNKIRRFPQRREPGELRVFLIDGLEKPGPVDVATKSLSEDLETKLNSKFEQNRNTKYKVLSAEAPEATIVGNFALASFFMAEADCVLILSRFPLSTEPSSTWKLMAAAEEHPFYYGFLRLGYSVKDLIANSPLRFSFSVSALSDYLISLIASRFEARISEKIMFAAKGTDAFSESERFLRYLQVLAAEKAKSVVYVTDSNLNYSSASAEKLSLYHIQDLTSRNTADELADILLRRLSGKVSGALLEK